MDRQVERQMVAAIDKWHGLTMQDIRKLEDENMAALKEKMLSNIREVASRGARVLLLATPKTAELADDADETFVLPDTDELLTPVTAAVAMQLLAYHAAVRRGCDVDKPRNLAKSVTVE